ncbi:MAG: DUF3536 domain-containing protein [Candidatus Omnitrophica bacterium]|nr:DUF3536 domain-containing protein [Candidatus Omnitrophota bacterium]
MIATRFVCIHGHFYQPPRENPWLEEIEPQPSARPYRDWNERITAECYAPNAAAGNYAKISFNFGPTLLSWLERKRPQVYQGILEQDRESRQRFSGHGSAIAQVYNHMILPLANRRDRVTQVIWGMRDFERRFGRKPEGMWLPETAVDLETLEILADQGISFTILAPHQAARVRAPGGGWRDAGDGQVDTTRAYAAPLPSGRGINLFFYHGRISRAVSFEGLLRDGRQLAHRLEGALSAGPPGPQLVHIASDGENYGHHHPSGEKALAACLQALEAEGTARLTNYGEFLAAHPPAQEAQILEKSSWSCTHGIDRWWSDCGCRTGKHPHWNQAWRTPLRNALDWLRDAVAPLYEAKAGELLRDPWAARDRYIDVVLDRSAESAAGFFREQAARPLAEPERLAALKLLELQRSAMLMYTSCGWFFDDIAGIEAVQVLQYAGRAIQLGEELFAQPLEPRFLEILGAARSNAHGHDDGRRVWERSVRKNLSLHGVIP